MTDTPQDMPHSLLDSPDYQPVVVGLKKHPLRMRLNSQCQPCNGMDNPIKLAQQAHWRHRTK